MTQQAETLSYQYQTTEGVRQGSYLYWPCTDAAIKSPPVLLCVHGLTRNARDFDILAQAMTDRYQVI